MDYLCRQNLFVQRIKSGGHRWQSQSEHPQLARRAHLQEVRPLLLDKFEYARCANERWIRQSPAWSLGLTLRVYAQGQAGSVGPMARLPHCSPPQIPDPRFGQNAVSAHNENILVTIRSSR